MVKSYLRYEPSKNFGVIAAPTSNVQLDESGKLAFTASINGGISVWTMRQSKLLGFFTPETSTFVSSSGLANLEVTFIKVFQNTKLAVGYNEGSVRVFTFSSSLLASLATTRPQEPLVFRGHKSPICQLEFSRDGENLASASRNGEIVVWDIVNEAGVARLKGHTDAVTSLAFVDNILLSTLFPQVETTLISASSLYLISSSKDKLVKVWDLTLKFCQQTVVEHPAEVTAFLIYSQEQALLTASTDTSLRLFKFVFDETTAFRIEYYGAMDRGSSTLDKISEMHWVCQLEDNNQGFFVLASQEKTVCLAKYYNTTEMKKVEARRRKRRAAKNNEGLLVVEDEEMQLASLIKAGDEIKIISTLRTGHKIRSVFPSLLSKDQCSLVIQTFDNLLEVYGLQYRDNETPSMLLMSVELNGHRQGIRQAILSNNNEILGTLSNDAIKLWNATLGTCFKTFSSQEIFPGHHFTPTNIFFSKEGSMLVASSKEGHIALLDCQTGDICQVLESAHESNIWTLVSGCNFQEDIFVSGSSDKMIHFWTLLCGHDPDSKPSLSLTRSLQMTDDILALKVSPENKFLAVALLDSTVKIFYLDTLRFYLSLYGHKLPVTCLDFSSDGRLIATGSSDKNIKIWGLDFGDCHRSLFAHQEAVTSLCFVPKTHYIFTSGKDKLIKYFDGDKFVQITKMGGHLSDVTSLSISKNGGFLVSASLDKSVRIWERTEDLIFLEEEREKDADEALDASLMENGGSEDLSGTLQDSVDSVATRDQRSISSLMHYEKLYELLDLIAEDEAIQREYLEAISKSSIAMIGEAPPKSSLLQAYQSTYKSKWNPHTVSTNEWIALQVVQSIPLAELEQAILLLPIQSVLQLLEIILIWINQGWQAFLATRLTIFILKVHGPFLTQHPSLKTLLLAIKEQGTALLSRERNLIGFNMTRCSFIIQDFAMLYSTVPSHLDSFPKRKSDFQVSAKTAAGL